MFLDDLPKIKENRNKGYIDWQNTIGHIVKFIYDDIEGEIKIIDYNIKTNKLKIEYNNDISLDIRTENFSRCKIGSLLKKRTNDYKIEIATRLINNNRDLFITDKKTITRYNKDKTFKCNDKMYKYKCNKCGFDCGEHYVSEELINELWVEESHLLVQKQGCACCNGNHITVEGINSIPITTPWMISYFQGGYNEAKKYKKCSIQKIYPICPDCGRIKSKKIKISDIYVNHKIGCNCSDSLPYTEKLMYSVLEQLDLDFKTQLSKTIFNWCKNYRYDFYFEFNDEKYICEVHGGQHYEKSSRGRSLEEEQENDRLKKELALFNGIKEENYIVIDCRYSELEFIKNNKDGILNSKLNELFDLRLVNWLKAEEFACCNLVKIACDLWKVNTNMTIKSMSKLIGCCTITFIKYLKRGSKFGWCYYNSKEEKKRNGRNNGILSGKQVEIFKDDISLGIFPSCSELERKSEEIFGVKLLNSVIAKVCRGELKQHKGYTFNYLV